jgi:Family of unknown function (DUF5338)
MKKYDISFILIRYNVSSMQKNLSLRISERVRNNRSSRSARNMAAFLAQRDEISSALKDGWTVYQIWETLHAEQKIAASYNTFCGQVKRLIVKRERTAYQSSAAPSVPSPPRRPAKPDGFTFSSTPNDEDIL